MKIGITITVFNRIRFTEQCLKSIIWSTPKNSIFVIVDNNSDKKTKELISNYVKNNIIFKKVFFNETNEHLGPAILKGWNYLKNYCEILGVINNDYLLEPGWEDNVLTCFEELNIDSIIGTVRPDREKERKITPSGNGKYTSGKDPGGARFLLTKHFENGVKHSSRKFESGYIGPGPGFHNLIKRRGLKSIRLAHPGIMVRDSEYNKSEHVKYYNNTFGTRRMMGRLNKFRKRDENGNPVGWGNWNYFLKKWYPEKYEIEKE